MSFGFSIGDILAVLNLAHGICRRIRDWPDQFRDISGEAANLTLVLNDLAEQISGGQLSSQQTAKLSTLVKGCQKVLEDLDAKVQKYDGLDTHASGPVAKTGKVWKKLKWDQSEVGELRSRLTSNLTSLEVFYSGITRQISHATNQKVDVLDDRLQSLQLDNEHKDRQAILDWLTSSNYPAQQAALSGVRQEGTGSWLIESEEFKTWSETDGKTLICQGIPGVGKTMLASLVIDHLKMEQREANFGVLYIYCDYKARTQQTPSDLIASLLKQSLQQQPRIPADVRKAYQDHIRMGTRLERHEMLRMLQNSMETFSQNYVIIDALDELSSQDQARHILLKKLRDLQAALEYNLLITSRHITNLTLDFQEPLCLEIRASSEDVQRYVRGHMTQLPNCVRTSVGLQENIVSSIVTAVDGMYAKSPIFNILRKSLTYQARFLLAQLHIDSLKDQTSPKAIRRTLQGLPNGSKALEQAYSGAIQRIEDQMEGFRTLAKQVLGWLTYAERLMSVAEVQHAIAVEPGTHRFDEDNLNDVNELVSVCAGLVVVDGQSNVIRLVHYTTQEYFEQNGKRLLPRAQQAIAESCLTYLLYEDFSSGWLNYDGEDSKEGEEDEEDEEDEDGADDDDINTMASIKFDSNYMHSRAPKSVRVMLQCHPFYEYAAQHWATHTMYGMDDGVKKLFLELARDDHKISRSAQLLWLANQRLMRFERYSNENKELKPVSAMHVLSYLGNDELISMLLEHGLEADIKDNNKATPLWWAVFEGHKKVVKLLLSRKTVDVNNVNLRSKHTALLQAAANGDVEIVKLMIAREDVDLNLGNWKDKTPLAEAIEKGHSTIVELLLTRNDVDINTRDTDGWTALATAVRFREFNLAKILLARADIKRVDQKDKQGWTPLMYAVVYGCQEVCKLLLSRKEVDVNTKDCLGWTPLIYAAGDKYQVIVELLLSHGSVDANIRSSDGSTALMYATGAGHEQTVELLLSHKGTDVNAKDTAGNTPLYVALALGRENVVKLLLAHAEIDLGIEDGKPQDAFAQVEQLAQAAFRWRIRRRSRARKWGFEYKRPNYDGWQASLKLLRAAIEERSVMA